MSCAFQFEKYYDSHSYKPCYPCLGVTEKKTWDIQGFKIKQLGLPTFVHVYSIHGIWNVGNIKV